jgi:hypothetical protein
MGCHDANPRTEEVGYMLLDESYATETSKTYLDQYWSLERREYAWVVSEGGGDQDNTTSTAVEEKEVEVLKAITEAGNIGSMNALRKCGFREPRRFLQVNGWTSSWRGLRQCRCTSVYHVLVEY